MLSYQTLYKGLKALCRTAGLPEVSPHELRHSCTELWVHNGASKEDCGRQLNQSNASTTERYMHRTTDRLEAIGANFTLPGFGEDGRPVPPPPTGQPALRLVRRDS
jgi:site-specific recombinase XerD